VPPIANLEGLARSYSEATWRVYALLDQSLDPRGPESLHELAGTYLTPTSRILDAGCRDAKHLIRLVRAYGGTGVGVDPVEIHIERAREQIEQAELTATITVFTGVMQELPYPDGHFDFIWCRDVLEQVADLPAGLRECARVLGADGRMLVYTVFASDLLSDREAESFARTLADVPANLVERTVENGFRDAGLVVERKEIVGSEWREHEEERSQPVSHALLQLSRLRRQREKVIEQAGLEIYEHVEAHLHWLVFIFLGKLVPTIYVLHRG
jgi:ubiquinone/menaquinone biosynthesis C-methylase UbiE